MERRRLALLCSHVCSTGRPPLLSALPPVLSTSACHASADGGGRPEGDTEKERCVFCLIIRGESPAFKLYEDDVCLCILDSNPLSFGHSLIIPKLHFPSLQATPPSVVAAMCSTVPFLTKAIMKATQCDSFNLLVNNGTAAGQVIFHVTSYGLLRAIGSQLNRIRRL